MKVHYLTVALAAAMSMTAMAGNFEKVQPSQTVYPGEVQEVRLSKMATELTPVKAPQKVASSVDDLVGFYTFTYCSWLVQSEEELVTVSTIIEAVAGENENQIVFKNFLGYPGDVYADVDFANSKLIFHNQEKFWYNEYYGTYTTFDLLQWNEDGRGQVPVDSIEASIQEGGIVFDWRACLVNSIDGGRDPETGSPVQGYFFFVTSYDELMSFVPYDMWEFNADEWENGGTAEFTDAWLLPMLGVNQGGATDFTYDVPYMVSKDNKDIILLVNPYGKGSIWTNEQFFIDNEIGGYEDIFNISTKDGYIYIDASNPDVVCVRGPIYSGYECELNGKFYMWNEEGNYKYSYGYDDDTIAMLMGYYDQNVSFKNGNNLTIYNCVFGCAGSFDPMGGWSSGGVPVVMTSLITLRPGENSVEGIEFDENAPVKYFNLQGVEVANPTKGQLVIKTQGSKAQKMIAK